MAIDDDEVAGRQRTHDVAGKLAQQGNEVLNAQGERSRRPVMLAREADGDGRKLPEIELIAPARNDAARELFRDDDVGIERQMRAVLLDRPDRQAEDRGCAQTLRYLGRGELSDRPDRWRAYHDARDRNQPVSMRMRTRSLRTK
jgi:hypothetical protein